MLNQLFATKQKMTQAWTKSGKRVAVTCLHVGANAVVGEKQLDGETNKRFEIGYGTKKLKNMSKPLRSKLEKSGFSFGVAGLRETQVPADSEVKVGDTVKVDQVLQVGDVVSVQGVTKGRGFAGAIKRHGFSGGPKTHGQSDRWRAVGAIGQRTTPGRVFRGKKMPGHYGQAVQSVTGLVVLYIDQTTGQLWLSGPVPGAMESTVRIEKTGETRPIEIDEKASGIVVKAVEAPTAEAEVETETVAVANEGTEEKAPEVEAAPEAAEEKTEGETK